MEWVFASLAIAGMVIFGAWLVRGAIDAWFDQVL